MLQPPPKLTSMLLALLLTSACTHDTSEQAWQEYLTRLGRTLDVEVPGITRTQLPPPPRSGRIQVELPASSLGSLDFLAISGCAVQVTIGKRNSNLGRLASPSQRLLLELEYLQLAPECIDYQRKQGNEELATTLETAWQLKRTQLPERIYNATLAGPEYHQFWRAKREAGGYPEVSSSQVLHALNGINTLARRWLGGDYRADNRDFEILLSEVAGGDGSKLVTALTVQGDYLQAVAKLEALVSANAHPDFLSWQQARDNLLAGLAQRPRRHVENIQQVWAPCGGIGGARQTGI